MVEHEHSITGPSYCPRCRRLRSEVRPQRALLDETDSTVEDPAVTTTVRIRLENQKKRRAQ